MKQTTNDVAAAFEMVLEEIEAEFDLVNRNGAQAFEGGKLELVQDLLSLSEKIEAFRHRVAALSREWQSLSKAIEHREPDRVRADQRTFGKLRKGLRTPEEHYWRPILESLVELGGKAQVSKVLSKVYDRMRKSLNEYDLQPLASDPDNPRWRNAAQWARNTLVKEGLMRNDSPRGEWAISSTGQRWLEEQQQA